MDTIFIGILIVIMMIAPVVLGAMVIERVIRNYNEHNKGKKG